MNNRMDKILHTTNFVRKEMIIKSPAGLEPDRYTLPLEWPMQLHHIVAQIRAICEDNHDLKSLIDSSLLDIKDEYWTFEKLVDLCDSYNDAIESVLVKEKQADITRTDNKASNEMIKHILEEVYSTVITNPRQLNHYKPFSPSVYGETNYDLIFQMIDEIGIQENDIFIDLGSGVGNVVLQMAASLRCSKCIGVEKEDIPAGFAKGMGENFRNRMAWYGKSFGDFKLIHEDFFSSEIRPMINASSIIFANNFKFGPVVDLKLNGIFKEMRDGTKILSSKAFSSINLKMNPRNLDKIGAIMHVAEVKPVYSSVSWTDNPISYFFHVMDSTKLNKFYENKTSTKEIINEAELIMKRSKCLSIKKGLLVKISKCLSIGRGFLLNISDLKKELEEHLLSNSELKSKNEEDFVNKLEESLHTPIEQSIEGPTTVAVSSVNSDLLKLLRDYREELNYEKTLQVGDQKLKEEIKLLETQRDEYIKQITPVMVTKRGRSPDITKGHRYYQGEMEDNPFDLDKDKMQDTGEDNEEGETPEGEEPSVENELKEMETEGDEEEGENKEEGGDVNVENQLDVEEPIIEEKGNQSGTEIEPEPEKPDGEGDDATKDKDEEKLDEDEIQDKDDGQHDGEDQVEPSEELKNRRDENVMGSQSKDEDEELQVATEEQKEPDPNDDTGSGQAESRSGVGVEGKMAKQKEQEKNPSSKEQEEKSAKEPSDMERKRTLVDQTNESSAKRLKRVEGTSSMTGHGAGSGNESSNIPNTNANKKSWPKKKVYKKPDPNAPKQRRFSGYYVYMRERRDQLRSMYPEMPFYEIIRQLSQEWNNMDRDIKQKYLDSAEAEKQNYEREISAYKKTESYKQMNKRKEKNVGNHSGQQSRPLDMNISGSGNSSFGHMGVAGSSAMNMINRGCHLNHDSGMEIQFFMAEFLDHYKATELELRAIRTTAAECKVRNSTLQKHVEQMQADVEWMDFKTRLQSLQRQMLIDHRNALMSDWTKVVSGAKE